MVSRAVCPQFCDDDPLNFVDWSLNPDATQPAVEFYDSLDKFLPEFVAELKESIKKLKDDKVSLESLGLWKAMNLYVEFKIPALRQTLKTLEAKIESLDDSIDKVFLQNPMQNPMQNAMQNPMQNDRENLIKKRDELLDECRKIRKKIKSLPNLPERVFNCGKKFLFGAYVSDLEQKNFKKILDAVTCQNRLCPACNARRAHKLSLEVLAQIVFMAENGFAICGYKGKKKKIEFKKGVSASFLTLTVENPKLADVKELYKKLKSAVAILFSKATRYKTHALRNDWIRKNILGALCCLEWFGDKTKDGEAHLHFHILLIHDGALPKNENYVESIFRRAWAKALGREGEWFSVKWEPMKDFNQVLDSAVERGVIFEKEKFSNLVDEKHKPLMAMVLEVSKYAVTQATLQKMSTKNIAELYKQTEFCRQVEKYGVLQGFEFPDGVTLDSVLERIFEDFFDVEKGDWLLRSFIESLWNSRFKTYESSLLDKNYFHLADLPELNVSPEKPFSAAEAVDVPLS